MVFLEQNVDAPVGDRISRWWTAYGAGGTVYLPLVMVDSGHEFSSSVVAWSRVYGSMVNDELARAPEAAIAAWALRQGDAVRVWATVTNLSGATLSAAANQAAVHALIWENKKVGTTSRIVRTAPFVPITDPLAPGSTAAFVLTSPALAGVDWTKLHTVVVVDYRPQGRLGAWDMLQAATATAPAMSAQPAAVSLRAPSGGPGAGSAVVHLSGPHAVAWQATPSEPWILVSPASGTLPAEVTLTAVVAALPEGTSTATVAFAGDSADGLRLTCQVEVDAERESSQRPLRVRLHGGP